MARITRAYLSWYRSDNNVWADSNGEFELLSIIAPTCRVVLDVGANVGDWSREVLKVSPSVSIHCFEAAPDNHATLVQSDLAGRAILNHVAVSNQDGEITLNLFGENSPLNSIVTPAGSQSDAHSRSIVVRAISIDNYIAGLGLSHVDFVKIDVEGAEMYVLEGMKSSLRQGLIDAVQFEYGPFSIYARTFMKDFFEEFNMLGFTMYKISQPKMMKFEQYSETMDNFSHQNWVAVRHGSEIARLVSKHSIVGKPL